MLVWRIVLNAFISQTFIQLDCIAHPFTCHKHRPLVSVFTSETFKFTHHECRKVMTAEGRLHPYTFYLYIAVAMFLQTGACHRDIIFRIDYHRIFNVLRLVARNKRLPVLGTTDKLVVEVLSYSVELLKLPVVAVSPSYSIIFHLSLVIYCIISILPGHPAPPWSKPLSSWIGISWLPIHLNSCCNLSINLKLQSAKGEGQLSKPSLYCKLRNEKRILKRG